MDSRHDHYTINVVLNTINTGSKFLYRWLLHDPKMKLRSTHPPFLAAVERYFDRLFPIVIPLQVSHCSDWLHFSCHVHRFPMVVQSQHSRWRMSTRHLPMILCTCNPYMMQVGGAHNGRGCNNYLLSDDEEERGGGIVGDIRRWRRAQRCCHLPPSRRYTHVCVIQVTIKRYKASV